MSAIKVEGLKQDYRVKAFRAPTLKAALGSVGKGRRRRRTALDGVDIDIQEGEMLGIIGANGSGKSTLLRCLAGIFRPTGGSVTVRGRTASLIDLTAGFQRDLTARDNVFLAGAIYGVPKALLAQRFEGLMEFAGLEDEADAALRTFSTGMAMRLGFSLAVSMEPDILLVDEVLAVGDEWFKMRCLEKVEEMRKGGTTIVFVSHELALVRSLCDRVIVMEEGRVAFDGPTQEGIETYCARLGVDLDVALSRPPVEPSALKRVERAWRRR